MQKIEGEKMYQVAELYARMGKRRYSTVDSWCAAVRLGLAEAGVQPVRVKRMCFYLEEDVRRVMEERWGSKGEKKVVLVAEVQALRAEVQALRSDFEELKRRVWVPDCGTVEKPVTLAPLAPSEPPAVLPAAPPAAPTLIFAADEVSWTGVVPLGSASE